MSQPNVSAGDWTEMADQSKSEAKTEQLVMPEELREKLGGGGVTDEDALRDGEKKVEQMIAANAPLADILSTLVRMVEAQSPGMLCSVLLLSPDGNHIQHGAAPNLPEHYVKAIDGSPIGTMSGSCGTAMYRGERVVVTDILTDPLWEDYRDLAKGTDLRACWSTPILSGRGKVLGSFAMYYTEPQAPSGEEARLTEVATRLAAKAIENQASPRS
jgi:GAF domain-containing protein